MIQMKGILMRNKEVIKRSFGKDSSVSLFTLGTMRAVSSINQMDEVVRSALSIGINHIETAPSYGHAEDFLGEVMNNLKRKEEKSEESIIITSKILPKYNYKEGKEVIRMMLKSLNLKINLNLNLGLLIGRR